MSNPLFRRARRPAASKLSRAGVFATRGCFVQSDRMKDKVVVRVPATSANLGPGFDCLGVALDLHNRVTVVRGGTFAPDTMVGAAADAFFSESGIPAFAFQWSIEGDIPRSRGLGSSVAVRLGILHALNAMSDAPLDADQLYRICANLEGHPDNAAPAAFGGFTAARADGTYFRCAIDPAVRFVFLIPRAEIDTESSRGLLPAKIPHSDAVLNVAHASLITAAFAAARYDLLRGSMTDWLHQPYRSEAVPHLKPAIEAGVAAGALGGYLSGSGSAVACITVDSPDAVAAAMQSVLPAAAVRIFGPDNQGVVVEA